MAYSVQKSRLAKVAGVSLVLLLAACSSDSRYKRQVGGDEVYLQATPLSELHAPAGMILPVQVGDIIFRLRPAPARWVKLWTFVHRPSLWPW
ncbi:Lipoprotein 34 precursor [Raoultella terrigena]|uniref:Lipoprotein 34 n=1 Tax=Raoultella terrigena TaxID=577 RepID=A0A4U9CZG3_RAOTE|nr:Lipoprotein 34 precursor [Raoultella terrigena]